MLKFDGCASDIGLRRVGQRVRDIESLANQLGRVRVIG